VRRCASAGPSTEAGFLLVEAVLAAALIALSAAAALGAVAIVMHAAARAVPAAELTATAQNVLADLRAATAYDPAQLAALGGRTVAFDAIEPAAGGVAQRVRVSVSIVPASQAAPAEATVTAAGAAGAVVTLRSALVQEAPAPGSVVPATAPPPAAHDAGGIQL
jgi:hypothetical protein